MGHQKNSTFVQLGYMEPHFVAVWSAFQCVGYLSPLLPILDIRLPVTLKMEIHFLLGIIFMCQLSGEFTVPKICRLLLAIKTRAGCQVFCWSGSYHVSAPCDVFHPGGKMDF